MAMPCRGSTRAAARARRLAGASAKLAPTMRKHARRLKCARASFGSLDMVPFRLTIRAWNGSKGSHKPARTPFFRKPNRGLSPIFHAEYEALLTAESGLRRRQGRVTLLPYLVPRPAP